MKSSIIIGIVLIISFFIAPGAFSQSATGVESPVGNVVKPGKTITGKASWYGPGLQGRETASGKRFDQNQSTAASNRLPLGTKAKVTNLRNGRSVKVRINDCGPNVDGRKIDLSRKAARHLAMTHEGVAPVKIKVEHVPPGAQSCAQIRHNTVQSRH